MRKKLTVDVWSDVVCPWCYVGKRRLEAALARFPHRDDVELVWRAFELDPGAPRIRELSPVEHLSRKYGRTKAQALALMGQLATTAAADGLDLHLETARSGNTFDAHRVLHLAAERGVQDAVKERFFRGYMTEGEPIGEPEVLVRLAAEAGLDASEVNAVLGSDRYASEVREEEEVARRLGISGVPFFVLAGQIGVSGAQPAEVLRGALQKAWEAAPAAEPTDAAEGAACGPDGCA
jgi:predicted DsbA family dithiol-disulfide isomerase